MHKKMNWINKHSETIGTMVAALIWVISIVIYYDTIQSLAMLILNMCIAVFIDQELSERDYSIHVTCYCFRCEKRKRRRARDIIGKN